MNASDYRIRAHQFLRDAMCKRAWGESLDLCDPSDLLDELLLALGGAIKAVDDGQEAAAILLDLYGKHGLSGPDCVSMLFRASRWNGSTSKLASACERAVGQAGVAVIDLLWEALADELSEEDADLLFDTCRFAVNEIPDLDSRLEVLRTAYQRALNEVDDPEAAESLREGREIAAQQQAEQAVETLLDYYRAAALEMAEDPSPFFEALIASLPANLHSAPSRQSAFDVLMEAASAAIAEGGSFLWEYYRYRLDELGESEHVEALLETHERIIHTVAEPKWVIEQVFEICNAIAYAKDDYSFWLPDRVQLSQACMDTIEAVGGPAAARNAMSRAFELAVQDTSNPWDVLAKALRDVSGRVGDDAMWRIADALVRASQQAMRDVYSAALTSARKAIEDRERIVDLLLEAAEGERAFWAFRRVQKASEEDRPRAVEWLLEALSEGEPNSGRVSTAGEPPEPPLFRALMLATTALRDPTTAANLLATIHMATQRTEYAIDIEHSLPAVAQIIATLDDPASEAEVLNDAYNAAITDGNDPSHAVDALLKAAKEAIAEADDPAVAIEVLLSGLSVQPTGWPPPTPAWLLPE